MQRAEQETSVAFTAEDEVVEIYTCIPKDLRALKKRDNATIVRSGEYKDGPECAVFHIPAKKFNIAMSVRSTRVMSDEDREAVAIRLAGVRARKEQS